MKFRALFVFIILKHLLYAFRRKKQTLKEFNTKHYEHFTMESELMV